MLLKEPIEIGKIRIANRLVMPPMHTGKSPDGKVTPEQIAYYVRRSGGGAVGLMITEFAAVSRQGRATPVQVSMAEDSVIEGHRALVEAVHQEGSRVICQINHAGSAAQEKVTGMKAVAPSAVLSPRAGKEDELPRPLSVDEIRKIEEDFVAAAQRVKAAGYDGVEIHGAHGYLYNQFFSPLLNRRRDAYGCDSVENRARIFTETIRLMRESLGTDFLIAVRFGGCDYTPGGSTLEDCVSGARLLAEAGTDLMDISGGICGPNLKDVTRPGTFGEAGRAVKQAVDIPVIVTGGVTTADQAEAILRAEEADLVGVGRALLKDPDWAKKAMNASAER